MADSFLATRYMTRFQCTGSACEDTCCGQWTIPISDADYRRVVSALLASGSDVDRATLDAMFDLEPPSLPHGALAVIRTREDGYCSLLDGEHLCGLHRRFGEPALPLACATYPRTIGRVGERYELTGTLSCPEVARLCLLADDALDAVPAPAELFGRRHVALSVTAREESEPYVQLFEPVREVLVGLSSLPRFPVATRQFFVGYLAHRLQPFFHRGAPQFDPARLVAELRELGLPSTLDALHDKFTAAATDDALPLQAVLTLLRARLEVPNPPAFVRLVAAVAGRYAEEAGVAGDAPMAQLAAVGVPALARSHASRRGLGDAAARVRIEGYFRNYCKDYWIHDWFLQSSSVLDHVVQLGLRLALLRFLFFGHPGLEAALASPDPGALDRLAVEVFYATTRAFDHNESVRASLGRVIKERGLATIAHVVVFLKL